MMTRSTPRPIMLHAKAGVCMVAFSVSLFDHLIRPLQERRRNRQAEGPGGLEVDKEFVGGRLLDGEVSRLRALQNPIHYRGSMAQHVGDVRAIRDKPSVIHCLSPWVDRWQSPLLHEDHHALVLEKEH